jgi:hypothetical protein
MPGGVSLELGTADSVRLWHAGWRADPHDMSPGGRMTGEPSTNGL